MYDEPNIAYSYGNEAELFGAIGILVVAVVIGLLIGIGIAALLAYFVSNWLNEVPEEDRAMTPGQVWLLLIPIFSLYWQFRVYMLDVPQSFKNYFDRRGNQAVGDCGKNMGMWLCICTFGSMIPLLGSLVGIVGLVLLVLWMVKIHELKNKIIADLRQSTGA
ncbi:MAG TPA: hypothetical protein DCX67_02700 [Opitutae bacterium]|nr:hypothetical protein [Opitutae bacterium]|tara:strand:+ start:1859 stop:2344 length:486 start_codon:yes stop_codon:yes gene_type:complete